MKLPDDRFCALFPDLPTVAEAGVPGYELDASNGVFAPARTPAPVINRLNQEIVRVLNRPEVKEQFLKAGTDVIGSTPQQLTAKMKGDVARRNSLVRL